MAVDLSGMSRQELLDLAKKIEKALKDAEDRDRKEALKAVHDVASKFGYSAEELLGAAPAPKKRGKSKAKYRNPENPEQTWTGRGRKPQWIHDALAKGLDITALEI